MNDWYNILPMSQVHHRLFVGGALAAANLAKDNPSKITAVLNVHSKPDEQQSPGIVYMHVPFEDGHAIPKKAFVKCLGWLKHMYEDGHTILIHCAAGISRSVVTTASFMHFMGIADFDQALHEIKMIRPVANPAVSVLISAKRMLGVYPYDGTYEQVPEHEKAIEEAFVWMDAARFAQIHTNDNCPMKIFLLAGDPADDRPRDEIPCTCETLNTSAL